MKKMNVIAIFSMVAAVGCIPIEEVKETGEEELIDEVDPMSASVSWGDSSVSLSITNGDSAASYNWGIAENSGGCLSSEWGCWTGEDCHMGFDLTSGGNYSYCHPVSSTGGSLAYGASPDAVAEGDSTVFGEASFSTVTTHVLDNAASTEAESCWVWGADTSYYNGYYKSCTEM